MRTRTIGSASTIARLLLLCLGVTALLGAQPTAAQEVPTQPVGPNSNSFGFTVRPFVEEGSIPRDSLDYQLPAGQIVVDQVTVSNLTDAEKSFYLYPADAYTTDSGGLALRQQEDTAIDAASWLALPVEQYTIPARSAALVPVTIAVPPDATPGDHMAGIVAEEIVPPSTTAETGGLQPIHRVAARVYLRVEGPTSAELHVSDISVTHDDPLVPFLAGGSKTSVTYTVTNRGNVRVALDSISVKISALLGYEVTSVLHTQDSGSEIPRELLPGSEVVLTQDVGSVPALGPLTATVSVRGTDPVSQEPVEGSASVRFWIVPWLLLLAVAVLLILLLLWRRRAAGGAGGEELEAGPSGTEADDLASVPVGAGAAAPGVEP